MFIKTFTSLASTIEKQYNENLFPKIFAGWALLTFLISFNGYFGGGLLSTYSALPCFPHFQSCKKLFDFINLIPLPLSYNESIFFTLIFGLIVLAAYHLYTKKYFITHGILWILLLIKSVIVLCNYGLGNFDYYDIAIIFIFLIYPLRTDLIKLIFVILYFLASTIKIHEGWILGTYFSTLYYGLPFVPDILIPVVTTITIIMQIAGCWLLLSKNQTLAKYTLYFFIFFHLYSTILVGYRYPITSLLSLLIIFIVGNTTQATYSYALRKKDMLAYIFIVLLFICQSIPYLIPGDQKLTLEGNNYGLYMFEANHQCISTVTTGNKDEQISATFDARNRCDPYLYLSAIQKKYCAKNSVPLSWTFDHSINGNDFKRIVDEPNACALIYKPFTHNTWIKTGANAKSIGLAYKNLYLANRGETSTILKKDGYVFSSMLNASEPAKRSPLQNYLMNYITYIEYAYWALWLCTLLVVLQRLLENTLKLQQKK